MDDGQYLNMWTKALNIACMLLQNVQKDIFENGKENATRMLIPHAILQILWLRLDNQSQKPYALDENMINVLHDDLWGSHSHV